MSVWPWPFTFWPQVQRINACRGPAIEYMCIKFGVDSSSRFSFTMRRHMQPRPPHTKSQTPLISRCWIIINQYQLLAEQVLKIIWEQRVAKAPIVTMRCPKFTPKTAPSLQWSPPHLIHPSLNRPSHHPKRHQDPFSHFATIHFPDRQTRRQMV